MTLRFSPFVFLLIYCLVYSLALVYDEPLFRYYPLHNLVTWGPGSVAGHGPAMAWYGILANALLVSAVAAFLLPDRWADRVFRNFAWTFPVAAVGISVMAMWKFFV
jgi:hypothetical protein